MMAELIIFVLIGGSLLATHVTAAVVYKIKTHSKKSVWWILNNEL